MRFLSSVASFGMQVRRERTMTLADGQMQVLQEGVYIKFRQGDVTAHEVEEAKQRLPLRGFKQEQDEVTEVSPISRLSSFDTDLEAIEQGWDAETKALVESELMKRANETSFVIYVEPTPVDAPWPKYDEFVGTTEELLEKLATDGISLSDTIRYERQHANRPALIEALEQALAVQEAEDAEREFVSA